MKERQKMVSPSEKISIRKQCEILEVSRSGLYYKTVGESEENLTMMRIMDEHNIGHPTYGVLQMQDHLRDLGYTVNEKRVRRLLRKMGIMAIYPKRNLSKLLHAQYIHPYLLRGLKIERANQVWAIDITYIPMAKGFMYLTAIIDVYSRYIVGWALSNTLDASVSIKVLQEAIAEHGKPEIMNSDQGCQFTCKEWISTLKNNEIKISMDGKGRALDNIYIERFWRTVKRDCVYLKPADDGWELYRDLEEFINEYNNIKHHQGIGRRIPCELYFDRVA